MREVKVTLISVMFLLQLFLASPPAARAEGPCTDEGKALLGYLLGPNKGPQAGAGNMQGARLGPYGTALTYRDATDAASAAKVKVIVENSARLAKEGKFVPHRTVQVPFGKGTRTIFVMQDMGVSCNGNEVVASGPAAQVFKAKGLPFEIRTALRDEISKLMLEHADPHLGNVMFRIEKTAAGELKVIVKMVDPFPRSMTPKELKTLGDHFSNIDGYVSESLDLPPKPPCASNTAADKLAKSTANSTPKPPNANIPGIGALKTIGHFTGATGASVAGGYAGAKADVALGGDGTIGERVGSYGSGLVYARYAMKASWWTACKGAGPLLLADIVVNNPINQAAINQQVKMHEKIEKENPGSYHPYYFSMP